MLARFREHNLHHFGTENFLKNDPQLASYNSQTLKAEYSVLSQIPINVAGVFLLSGGRQLGKSTCFKLIMARLLAQQVLPQNIYYLPCDSIVDRTDLYHAVKEFLEQADSTQMRYLFIDEATYVEQWERSIKAIVDEGLMLNVSCHVSSSDKILLEDAITRLPGRRGDAVQTNFELKPLSYREVINLIYPDHLREPAEVQSSNLKEGFKTYLKTGGYITALNQFVAQGAIESSLYRVYSDWVVGDLLRLGRSRINLAKTLSAIFETYGSQVTYSGLAQKLEAISVDAFQEYCQILERISVLSVQHAFDQNKLWGFPKKAKKFHFNDPFISSALSRFVVETLGRCRNLEEPELVESIAYNHYARLYPTYYIKGDGEIDLVYVKEGEYFPVEIKWRNQIRSSDLKEISKYAKISLILTKEAGIESINSIPTKQLVTALYCLGQGSGV